VFGKHDPADECGNFGTATALGGNNCYMVVHFRNVGTSTVSFAPEDLAMVDRDTNAYTTQNVLPVCFDSIDINALQTIAPKAPLSVQLRHPVITGAVPQAMKRTRSLAGLLLTVPTQSIVGTWGGA
jgi:hypothetical protein